MLLSIATTHSPATDLGFLLHKHPDRAQSFDVGVGVAHVFYPEAGEDRCTATMLLEVDPIGLVRRGPGSGSFALEQYVNDRPYVASSLLSVALGRVFGTAMAGVCKGHEELAGAALPLEVDIPVLGVRDGESLIRQLFEPLGYEVECSCVALDPEFPEWGESRYVRLQLRASCRLVDLLNHLYMLLPVLDDDKHYWVNEAEIEKLLRRGSGWLAGHPEQALITRRYLKGQASLYRPALAAIGGEAEEERGGLRAGEPATAGGGQAGLDGGQAAGGALPLREQRLAAVRAALRASGARRVLDLGCGAGALLRRLVVEDYDELVGVDVSARALQAAARALKLEERLPGARPAVSLWQSALTYRDARLGGYDAAALVEVIEHLDPDRLAVAVENLFGRACPGTVVVTTPNGEYNVRYGGLDEGELRHTDHRFEFTRAQFRSWAGEVADRYGYAVEFETVGALDPEVGSPTQMAVFKR